MVVEVLHVDYHTGGNEGADTGGHADAGGNADAGGHTDTGGHEGADVGGHVDTGGNEGADVGGHTDAGGREGTVNVRGAGAGEGVPPGAGDGGDP